MHFEFHKNGRIFKDMNSTCLTLIPNVPNPMNCREYKPIILMSCLLKLLATILENHLKNIILPLITSPIQGAFVASRQILNGVLIAIKLIDSRKRSKVKGSTFKVDLEKAYDHVGWGLLITCFIDFGSMETKDGRVRECVSTTSFYILVNDSLLRLFKASRGVRQGDP